MNRHLFLLVLLLSISACGATAPAKVDPSTNPFTHGNVQLTLKKGITDQAEVLNTFGAPNVATTDAEGNEVWTYQKYATLSKSSESSSYGTVVLLGGSSANSGFEQSSRTMTLIIKFDSSKKVIDFRSMSTNF